MAELTFRITDDRSGDIKRVTLAEFDHWKRAGYRVLDPASYDNAVAAANPQPEQPAPANEMTAQMNADAAAAAFAHIEAAGGTSDESNPDVAAAYQAMADSGYEDRIEAELVAAGVPMTDQESREVGRQMRLLRQAGVTQLPSAESVLASIRRGE